MPALTMRGRYLMREYWSDSDLFLRLSAEERELYVGLWMLADDDGWLPRDVPAMFHRRRHWRRIRIARDGAIIPARYAVRVLRGRCQDDTISGRRDACP